jgi:hypothetical protein
MNVLWLFDSCGPIVASAMWLAGFIALYECARTTILGGSRRSARNLMLASLLPFAAGVAGFLVGALMLAAGFQDNSPWSSLGKCVLAGVVVTTLPLVWSLVLWSRRSGGEMRPAS